MFQLLKFIFIFSLCFSSVFAFNYKTLEIEYETENDEEIELEILFGENFENDDVKIQFTKLEDALGKHYKIELLTKNKIELDEVEVSINISPENYFTYFCNGFQSWTTSKEFFANEKIDKPAVLGKLIAKYYGDYTYFKYKARKGNFHSWTYTYFRDTTQQKIKLLASVAEFSGFTIFSYQVKKNELKILKEVNDLELDSNYTYTALEWVDAFGEENELFKWYAEKNFNNVKKEATKKGYTINPSNAKPQQGWTSWYNYYRDIATDTILNNLNAFKNAKIPIGIFQIDDGFQKSIGEWTQSNNRFPLGMKAIADSIHQNNIKAGLWLAPYIVEKKSNLFIQHSEWTLKNQKGKPIKAGYNPLWSGWYYPLNIYNKDVQQYLKNTFDTILNKQEFDMVKLDFLFAACIAPPENKTRGEMMFDAMLMLREWCGDKFILGCGVPLGTAFHLVDYCRVSSDIHMKWEQKIMKAMDMHERVSVWSTVTSNIGRRHLNGNMFLNDPDVFVLRNEKNNLAANEKQLLYDVNNLFGSLVFTSDYIANYNSETMNIYKYYFKNPFPKPEKLKLIAKDIYQFKVNGVNKTLNLKEKSLR